MARTVTGESAGAFGSYTSQVWPALTAPTFPATGVPVTNPSTTAVTVVISANGATITNVSVGGVTVGAGAGTYTLPGLTSISCAYTVATPTWTWAVPVTFLAALNANGTPVAITGVS